MPRLSWKLTVALALVGASVAVSLLHFAVFHDLRTFAFYLLLDVAFVPLQVLLVTLLIERLLNEREKTALLHKLNMVIGAFFSEVGTQLLRRVNAFAADSPELAAELAVSAKWTAADFSAAAARAQSRKYRLAPGAEQLGELKLLLQQKRGFILGLLQNPNLLEHEAFTDLLWAVCHLSEELDARPDFSALPATDREHLQGDVGRAYGLLIREWLVYMSHLKTAYPYIFSLALRTNPFLPAGSAVVH